MELSQSPADKQQEELQVLRSIFSAEDFLPPPPKDNAWNVKVSRIFWVLMYAERTIGTTRIHAERSASWVGDCLV